MQSTVSALATSPGFCAQRVPLQQQLQQQHATEMDFGGGHMLDDDQDKPVLDTLFHQ
jgi:hypothetical protein